MGVVFSWIVDRWMFGFSGSLDVWFFGIRWMFGFSGSLDVRFFGIVGLGFSDSGVGFSGSLDFGFWISIGFFF
jgi:hypothetical protein